MSKIEDTIRSEREAAEKKAEARAKASARRQASKWDKWVEEEKPRAAMYHAKVSKTFPCLKGDFKVNPRQTPGYTDESFAAIVNVKGHELEIKYESEDGKNSIFYLYVPYETNTITGWKTNWHTYKIKSDADLKERIRLFILDCEYQEERARAYYDSFPIGNTD